MKTLLSISAALILGCQSLPSFADTLINNAQILSAGDNNGKLVDILIKDGMIVEIADKLVADDATTVVDAGGKQLTAGFFNANTQLGLVEVGAVSDTNDFASKNERITASLRVSDAINPSSVLLPHNRMLGVTHALVMPDSKSGLFAGMASIINLTEVNTVEKSAAAMVVTLGASGKKIAGGSRAAAMGLLREAFEDARDYRANKSQYNSGSRRDYQLSRHDLEALLPVLAGRLPLIVHVDRAVDIERVIDLAKQFKLKLIVAGAIEGWRVAKLLADNNVPVIIDPIMNLPTSYDTLGARLDNAKLLDEAGVTLLLTGMSWHNTHNAYLVRQSAGNAVANGLAYTSAIKALTVNPGKVFGLDGFGEIAEGAKANLVLWSADPLEPSTIVEAVMINGVDYPLSSRATRLRDRYFMKLQNAQ